MRWNAGLLHVRQLAVWSSAVRVLCQVCMIVDRCGRMRARRTHLTHTLHFIVLQKLVVSGIMLALLHVSLVLVRACLADVLNNSSASVAVRFIRARGSLRCLKLIFVCSDSIMEGDECCKVDVRCSTASLRTQPQSAHT